MKSILITLALLTGCASVSMAQTDHKKLNQFLKTMEFRCLNRPPNAMLKLFEKNYKNEQLDNFLDGNKEQFLNEFFCGTTQNGYTYNCLQFDLITALNFKSIISDPDKENAYLVKYSVIDRNGVEVTAEISVIRPNPKKEKFALVGALG